MLPETEVKPLLSLLADPFLHHPDDCITTVTKKICSKYKTFLLLFVKSKDLNRSLCGLSGTAPHHSKQMWTLSLLD